MARTRTLVIVLAGGAGGRLQLLTRHRAKPAVPYAGSHRLVDFPLSNAHNAGLGDVWISQQFNPMSLSDHLANGRPWDLDRTTGGLLILQPRQGHDDRTGFQTGTADALWRFAPLMREFAADAVVVVSADAAYALDYGAVVEEHRESGAGVTMVTTEVEPDDAGRYGVVQAEGGRVVDYAYKPEEPAGSLVASEVFAFTPTPLLDRLDALAKEAGEEGLKDLGHELLPALVREGEAREHRLGSYWRDVGTVESYWESHQELLGPEPPIDLDDPDWPILTGARSHRGPARVAPGASVEASLLAPGARVGGQVERSVVGRGATVEEGATVRHSVILPGAVIRAGAHVERAVVDDDVDVRARVGGDGPITLVGLGAVVEDDVPAGGRFPEVDEDD